jgi:hypothetical protein
MVELDLHSLDSEDFGDFCPFLIVGPLLEGIGNQQQGKGGHNIGSATAFSAGRHPTNAQEETSQVSFSKIEDQNNRASLAESGGL